MVMARGKDRVVNAKEEEEEEAPPEEGGAGKEGLNYHGIQSIRHNKSDLFHKIYCVPSGDSARGQQGRLVPIVQVAVWLLLLLLLLLLL